MQYTIPLSIYIALIDSQIAILRLRKQHEVKECARHTLQHENLLKGTNNLTGSHKQSFIVFIPHLWPTISDQRHCQNSMDFMSSENVLVFTLQSLYFETYVMVRIVGALFSAMFKTKAVQT